MPAVLAALRNRIRFLQLRGVFSPQGYPQTVVDESRLVDDQRDIDEPGVDRNVGEIS